MKRMLDQAASCTECGVCMEVCPTYRVKGEELFSPMGRMKEVKRFREGKEIGDISSESLNSCLGCLRCEAICPEDIRIADAVFAARSELAKRGMGPPERQRAAIEGILTRGNAADGDPERRLDWLPEEFPHKDSDTLLYVGCLASYILKEAAASAYLVLKRLGVDFMLLPDERCCGTLLYENGRIDLAHEYFLKTLERFKSLGIRKIIALCPACQYCFQHFYPQLLGDLDISVCHVAEVIASIPEIPLKSIHRVITYQDPCRLGRAKGITKEPRKVLKQCGAELKEIKERGEEAPCCGAGGGVRMVYRDLSLQVAYDLLDMAKTDSIVSTCPFCVFHLNYASRKKELTKRVTYFTEVVRDSLEIG
jgi:Fe-S oxidoreductase